MAGALPDVLVERVPAGAAPPDFRLHARILGPGGANLKFIWSETGANVLLKGTSEPGGSLHLALRHTNRKKLGEASLLAKSLIESVYREYEQWCTENDPQNAPPPNHGAPYGPPLNCFGLNASGPNRFGLNAPPPNVALNAPPPNVALNAPPPNRFALNAPPPNHVALNSPPPNHVALNVPPPNHVALNAPPPNHVALNVPPPNHNAQNAPSFNEVAQSPLARPQNPMPIPNGLMSIPPPPVMPVQQPVNVTPLQTSVNMTQMQPQVLQLVPQQQIFVAQDGTHYMKVTVAQTPTNNAPTMTMAGPIMQQPNMVQLMNQYQPMPNFTQPIVQANDASSVCTAPMLHMEPNSNFTSVTNQTPWQQNQFAQNQQPGHPPQQAGMVQCGSNFQPWGFPPGPMPMPMPFPGVPPPVWTDVHPPNNATPFWFPTPFQEQLNTPWLASGNFLQHCDQNNQNVLQGEQTGWFTVPAPGSDAGEQMSSSAAKKWSASSAGSEDKKPQPDIPEVLENEQAKHDILKELGDLSPISDSDSDDFKNMEWDKKRRRREGHNKRSRSDKHRHHRRHRDSARDRSRSSDIEEKDIQSSSQRYHWNKSNERPLARGSRYRDWPWSKRDDSLPSPPPPPMLQAWP